MRHAVLASPISEERLLMHGSAREGTTRANRVRRVYWRQGLRYGLLVAAIYSVIASIAFALGSVSGKPPLPVELPALLLAYVIGGAAGGSLVGWLFPLSRYSLGRGFLGYLLAVLVVTPVCIALFGLPWKWTEASIFAWVISNFMFGTFLAFAVGVVVRDMRSDSTSQ